MKIQYIRGVFRMSKTDKNRENVIFYLHQLFFVILIVSYRAPQKLLHTRYINYQIGHFHLKNAEFHRAVFNIDTFYCYFLSTRDMLGQVNSNIFKGSFTCCKNKELSTIPTTIIFQLSEVKDKHMKKNHRCSSEFQLNKNKVMNRIILPQNVMVQVITNYKCVVI